MRTDKHIVRTLNQLWNLAHGPTIFGAASLVGPQPIPHPAQKISWKSDVPVQVYIDVHVWGNKLTT